MRAILCILVLMFTGLGLPQPSSAHGTTAVVAEKIYIVSTEQICIGNEQVTITTFSDSSFDIAWSDGHHQYFRRDGSGAPDISGMGESSDSSSTVVNDDDSSFTVTVTTWKRPGESLKEFIRRHVKSVWAWQDALGLAHAPKQID